MPSLFSEGQFVLSDNDKAAAINLAFLLDINCYNTTYLQIVSLVLTEREKRAIYDFWANLTPETHRAYLCMAEYEGRI